MRETGWTEKADECGFLAVFPEASRPNPSKPANFRHNPQTWNDGSGRFRTHVDDVRFIGKLIEDLKARFHIDSKRIFATGFSNGASMTYRVGIELSNTVAAIAPVAGALWIENPMPQRPVPLLYITGTQDPLNPIDGGIPRLAIGGRGLGGRSKPPVEKQIKKWARMLHCSKQPKVIHDRDGVIGINYSSCDNESEVIFYTIDGMGHTWPGGFSILPEAWVGKVSDHKQKPLGYYLNIFPSMKGIT
jgi:polyhydroxybutyrate depolymerase